MGSIAELWVYPVKACRGVSVKSARVTNTGFELDRAFCVVDTTGNVVWKGEAISQRALPVLATIDVALSASGDELTLSAPGMRKLNVPTAVEAYQNAPEIEIFSSGNTTPSLGASAPGAWDFGSIMCRCYTPAGAWLNEYLNRDDPTKPGAYVSGKTKTSTFALIRSVTRGLEMSTFKPELPVVEKSKIEPEYTSRFAGNSKHFADFCPFLLVNTASYAATARLASVAAFNIQARANIIVDAHNGAWAEETWATVEFGAPDTPTGPNGGVLTLHKIKECPRCTVPCRDGHSGGWVFPGEKLKLWKVLKKAFPGKASDAEWGCWAGVFFGIYMGNAGIEGATLTVGDALSVTAKRSWDAHIRRPWVRIYTAATAALLAVLALAIALLQPVLIGAMRV